MSELTHTRPPFDFGHAITQVFRTPLGTKFGWRLVLWTAAFTTLLYVIVIPFIVGSYGDILTMNWQNMQSLRDGDVPLSDADDMAIFKTLAIPYTVLMLGFWLIYASADAALHRAGLRGESAGGIPHRFGGDELRVMLAQLGVWVIMFLVYFLGAIILGVLIGATVMLSTVLGVILGIIVGIALFAALCFVAVRLSPAAALAVYDGKARLLAGNKPAKGRFWWMTLAYLVVGIGGYILYFIVMSILMGLGGGLLGIDGLMEGMMGLGDQDPGPAFEALLEKFKNPVVVIVGVIIAFLFNVFSAIWLLGIAGIGTYVVKLWKGDDRLTTFD